MPFAVNPIDGVQVYFEDDGGPGPCVIFTYGLMDPIPAARALRLASALSRSARLVFVDHRGHGNSDKPHDVAAYTLSKRVADILAVLDAIDCERAHYIGVSWGARLGYALADSAGERLLTATLIANQPYVWNRDWDFVVPLSDAIAQSLSNGMPSMLEWFERMLGRALPEAERTWLLENDPAAISAAWTAAMNEGVAATHLGSWWTPCLIVSGELDPMYPNALRAAGEIPGSRFISLPERDHLSSLNEIDVVLPSVLDIILANQGRETEPDRR